MTFHVKHPPDHLLDHVSRETFERLTVFATLLARWNSRINLVAAGDLDQLWTRHIADSLQLMPDLTAGAAFVDLGSGGGFPGLVLAVATGNPATLIESDVRKASFLREAARATGADATVLAHRIEQVELAPVRFVTARALAPLPQLLDWASRFLAPDGTCLFLKGRRVEVELTTALAEWHMTVFRRPSRTDSDGIVIKLSDITRARKPDRTPGR